MLSECVAVGVRACANSAREIMYFAGMTVQICQDLDCSPNEHTHTHTHMPAWVALFC